MNLFKNNKYEVGIDEAGRGPFLGPVFAGAVIWGNAPLCDIINDSKKLSKKKRKEALAWIKENIKDFAVGMASVEEIDKYNILEATKLAMQRAVDNLSEKNIDSLLIDGVGWENKFIIKTESIVKGDSKYYNIAAASILAKEAHDEYIIELCNKEKTLHDKYHLMNNMGYGTKKHIEGIKEYGLSE